jgi:predicted nucleic acid-binding protein
MKPWLLDTVTISELRKGKRTDSNVLDWFKTIDSNRCWLSVISLTEILTGIKRVKSKDKIFADKLEHWYHEKVLPQFRNRLCLIDQPTAELAAEFIASKGLTTHDAYIAATAATKDFTLVTRNIDDFSKTEVRIINPWRPLNL